MLSMESHAVSTSLFNLHLASVTTCGLSVRFVLIPRVYLWLQTQGIACIQAVCTLRLGSPALSTTLFNLHLVPMTTCGLFVRLVLIIRVCWSLLIRRIACLQALCMLHLDSSAVSTTLFNLHLAPAVTCALSV